MEQSKQNWYEKLQNHVIKKENLKRLAYPVHEDPEQKTVTISNYRRYTNKFVDYGKTRPTSIDPLLDCLEKVSVDKCVRRTCNRCEKFFDMYNGKYVSPQSCWFHPLKFFNGRYECCLRNHRCKGCREVNRHVWSGPIRGPLQGYVKTLPGKNIEAFAIDCEMCYTTNGQELLRVSVVNTDGKTVYDQLAIPDNPIVDLCDFLHGITKERLQTATKRLKDIQKDLLQIISEDTILIGHSLENDLRALKIVHYKVVDTSLVFPHPHGFPKRLSLKQLAFTRLNLDIHGSHHDSVEDARVCMLLLQKLFFN